MAETTHQHATMAEVEAVVPQERFGSPPMISRSQARYRVMVVPVDKPTIVVTAVLPAMEARDQTDTFGWIAAH